MPRPKKIKSPEDFGKEFEKEREVEEDKHAIPAEKKYSPEVEAVGKAWEAFCENPNKETEKELYERSRELGRAIGGGITTEKVDEELKKYDNQMGKTDLSDLPETKFEKAVKEAIKEGAALEEFLELEKKLRACTDETPRDIKYEFFGNEVVLHLAYNNIEVDASIPTTSRYYRLKTAKPYLATAQKMLVVLEEWRDEQ